jgi:protein-disulfide isomerase
MAPRSSLLTSVFLAPLVVAFVVLGACESASPLDNHRADTDKGADVDLTALTLRLDKVELEIYRVTGILQGHPSAAQSPTEYNAARFDRLEKQLDKVIAILRQAMPVPEPDAEGMYAVPIGKADPIEGPADAKVTIVEGFEFLCPFCYKANPTVDQILAKYPSDVRLVSKYLIIHGAAAIPPGMVACAAAKQGKFKEMKAALWSTLFKEVDGRPAPAIEKVTEEVIAKLAKDAGVDLDKLKTDMAGDACHAWIADSQEVMAPLGATSTPAFFINGRFIGGAQPFDAFDALIKEELAKADDKIKGGVAQGEYYDKEIVAKGQKRVKGPLDD